MSLHCKCVGDLFYFILFAEGGWGVQTHACFYQWDASI